MTSLQMLALSSLDIPREMIACISWHTLSSYDVTQKHSHAPPTGILMRQGCRDSSKVALLARLWHHLHRVSVGTIMSRVTFCMRPQGTTVDLTMGVPQEELTQVFIETET
jgi:hypothetical protein